MRRPKWPVLGHRYRLIRQIDAGGMGSVWLAEAVHLRSLVAVKIMDGAVAATPEAAQRFLHEARTAASLRSPHVVQILDYGVHESTPFIVMELLEGESLAARLKREGRLARWEQTELVVRHVARALARAHDVGVIHRDLKPGNIFLVRDEEEEVVKLLDFGIAKSTLSPLGAPLPGNTRTGEFLGSPAYSSPEQLQASKAIDHRADIWSLGVIAYECSLGRAPFASGNFVALLLSICTGPLPIPSEHGPVPAGFDAWFARVCARDVEQRFQSVREAAAELRRLVGAAPGAARVLTASDAPASAPAAASVPAPAIAEGAKASAESAPSEPLPDVASAADADAEQRAPEQRAPEQPSRTALMTLPAPPNPWEVPSAEPPFLRTDTVRLVTPEGVARRRRRTTLTVTLALPAIVALSVFSLGASSSRGAFEWSLLALSAGSASAPARDDAPERASDAVAASDAPARGAEALPVPPPARGEPSPGVDVAPSSDESSRAVAAPDPGAAPSARHEAAPRVSSGAPRTASAAASRGSARLSLSASAPSQVLLDGVPIGATPLESVRVEPGTHEVTFVQNGRRSIERLTIGSGEHKRVEARIDPPPGDGLDEAAVKRTIGTHRDAVVDTCWDYAFASGAPGAPTSVRVPITIRVEPSGVVRSVVSATEPPGYPDLRRCIEERVSSWRFPDARADTVVNVAFVFALR